MAQITDYNDIPFNMSWALGDGMVIVAGIYIIFYIKERVKKSKHLQMVSGVNVMIFWCTALCTDLLFLFIIFIPPFVTIAAVQVHGYQTPEQFGRVILILIFFGFYVLPFIYVLSHWFDTPSIGFYRILTISVTTGFLAMIFIHYRDKKCEEDVEIDLVKIIQWILLFTPFYSLYSAVLNVGNIYIYTHFCEKVHPPKCTSDTCYCCNLNYYSMRPPGIGSNIVIAFSLSLLLFTVVIINEYGLFTFILRKVMNKIRRPLLPALNTSVDSDVEEENHKIRNTSTTELNKQYFLVLRDVTKIYPYFIAVNRLCLGIKPYECLGLLGPNGAGKTTVFHMLTKEVETSFGEIWANGLNMERDQKKVLKLMGYCPQFEALLENLTAKETLKMFALIRGVPYNQCATLGENLAREFRFHEYINKKVKELSSGSKKKLSAALALIGDPAIIYLDEPTTGLDPAAKRHFWTAFNKQRDKGKCIILSSHSMEECEALCTRIAIMVNGSFECLGSVEQLKHKFAQGYTLTIKVKKDADDVVLENDLVAADKFVKTNFPGAELKEKYQQQLSYRLKNAGMMLSTMFGILEKGKKQLGIEYYSLGQCSLEQVFLSFTKKPQWT